MRTMRMRTAVRTAAGEACSGRRRQNAYMLFWRSSSRGWLAACTGCLIPMYSADPARRAQQLIFTSEDLRTFLDEWERIWFLDQPSHMKPLARTAALSKLAVRLGRDRSTPGLPIGHVTT